MVRCTETPAPSVISTAGTSWRMVRVVMAFLLFSCLGPHQARHVRRFHDTDRTGRAGIRQAPAHGTKLASKRYMKTYLDWSAYDTYGAGDAYAGIPASGGNYA